MNLKRVVIGAILIALIGGVFYYGISVPRAPTKNMRMGGEDLQTFVPGDQWKWHMEVPLHFTGNVTGDIYLHIDAWGNYTGLVDYNVNGTIEKAYYISLEGWGLGDGTLDTSYGNFDVKINNDSSSGSSGYDSTVPFRVLGHRIVRTSDLADIEMKILIPDSWLHAYGGWLIGYDEMEMKLDSNLTFWNETKPYIPDNMDFPVNVGEKMWYNTNVHTWGYSWHGNDTNGWISEDNSPFDDNATWNYTFTYPTYHDVTVGAGTFSCYNATGTNATGESHIYLEYAPALKWYAKETYENIRMGNNGYMTLEFNVTSYNVQSSLNSLTLNPNELYQGDSLAISGNIPDAHNKEITIAIPEHGIYLTTTSNAQGDFSYTVNRFPLLNDTTHTSIDYGSVGIVAYPSSDPSDLCVATLTIHKLPSHIIYGYIHISNINLNNTTVNITNVATGDIGFVSPDSSGYYEIDISYLPYGYKDGEEIKGVLMENGTVTSYSNTTTVDTSVTNQRMDFNENIPEFGNYILALLVISVAIIIRKFKS